MSNPADPNFYQVLAVEPGANRAEIDRAYLARKAAPGLSSSEVWDLERAYVTLSDPILKRAYDEKLKSAAHPPPPVAPRPRGRRSSRWRALQVPLLLGLLGVLAVGVWQVLVPFVGWRFYTHSAGTELERRDDGRPFGQVVAYESGHAFPGGIQADAYLIRSAGAEGERWLTREEINRLTRRRR